jgi:hypothetical protein
VRVVLAPIPGAPVAKFVHRMTALHEHVVAKKTLEF